jgi:hypothetical protein
VDCAGLKVDILLGVFLRGIRFKALLPSSFLHRARRRSDLIFPLLPSRLATVMSSKSARRKCRGCSEFFKADDRNRYHQVYCSKSDCRRASKAASQKRWLRKTENRDYFRGPENTRRVQGWRKAHLGYWRPKSSTGNEPTPSRTRDNTSQSSCNATPQCSLALQDVPVFIGLISMVTGSTLQEDIASTARQLQARGRDILGQAASEKLEDHHDYQTADSS